MSLIHQKLYQSNNLAKINIKTYLEELFTYVFRSFQNLNGTVDYRLSLMDYKLSITRAVPLGLIVNELLTNSFKYGISEEGNSTIHVDLFKQENKIILEISDSGKDLMKRTTNLM